MVLVLDDADVRCSIDMPSAIDAIEQMCREQVAGTALSADRVNLKLPRGWIRLMPGALLSGGVFGYKEFHLAGGTVRYAFHLFDVESGEPLAMMDANYLTALRTGAAAGAATRAMAPEGAARLGVIGSGGEARTQLEAVLAVRPIRSARVFSRSAERRDRFAREMTDRFGVPIVAVSTPQAAIEDAEILVAATNTVNTGPALLGAWLRKGLHVTSIGSTLPEQREVDPDVWRLADRIVVDTRRLLDECGDGIAAAQAGAVDPARVFSLEEVISGQVPGRVSADETTLYKSVGIGLQDVAVAVQIYRQAKARGLGRQAEPFQSIKRIDV